MLPVRRTLVNPNAPAVWVARPPAAYPANDAQVPLLFPGRFTPARLEDRVPLSRCTTLNDPSVSSTTASAASKSCSPAARTAAWISSSVTRARRSAAERNSPRKNSMRGSPVTSRRTQGTLTLDQVTMNCIPISKAKARAPSASATSLLSRMVAKVEPRETVTTRSKAFIFDKVRFPDIRRKMTSAT